MKFSTNLFSRRLNEAFTASKLTKKEITHRVNQFDEGINFNSMRLKRAIDQDMDLTTRETYALAYVLDVHPAWLLGLAQYRESFTKKDMAKAYQAGYEDAEQHGKERAAGLALPDSLFEVGE